MRKAMDIPQVSRSRPASAPRLPENIEAVPPIPPSPSPFGECRRIRIMIPMARRVVSIKVAM